MNIVVEKDWWPGQVNDYERQHSLGGTDVAAILGVHPKKSALHVKAEKTGQPLEVVDVATNPYVEWGLRNEGNVRLAYEQKNGFRGHNNRRLKNRKVVVPEPIHHPEYDWAHASPDGICITPEETWGLEIKTTLQYKDKYWGETNQPPNTQMIPIEYWVQVLWYMWVFNLERYDVAVLIGGWDYRQFTFVKDERVAEQMADVVSRADFWWHEYILRDQPVPIQGSEADQTALKQLYNKDLPTVIYADETVEAWAQRLVDVKAKIKPLKAEKTLLEGKIKYYMTDAGVLDLGAGGKITHKAPVPKVTTHWQCIAAVLARSSNLSEEELMQLREDHTVSEDRDRRFSTVQLKLNPTLEPTKQAEEAIENE